MKENEHSISHPEANFKRRQKRKILTECNYNRVRNSNCPFSLNSERKSIIPNENERTYKFYKENIGRFNSKNIPSQIHNPLIRNSLSSEDSSNYLKNLQKAYEVSNINPFAALRYNTEELLKENMAIDLSSIKSSPNKAAFFLDKLNNLKNELVTLDGKIKIREEKLASRYIENYGLRYTIKTLQEQLELIRDRNSKEKLDKSQCIGCNIF